MTWAVWHGERVWDLKSPANHPSIPVFLDFIAPGLFTCSCLRRLHGCNERDSIGPRIFGDLARFWTHQLSLIGSGSLLDCRQLFSGDGMSAGVVTKCWATSVLALSVQPEPKRSSGAEAIYGGAEGHT